MLAHLSFTPTFNGLWTFPLTLLNRSSNLTRSSLSFCRIMNIFFFDVYISSCINQSSCAQLQSLAHSYPLNFHFLLLVWRQNMAERQILRKIKIWKFNPTRAPRDGSGPKLYRLKWQIKCVQGCHLCVFSANRNSANSDSVPAMWLNLSEQVFLYLQWQDAGPLTSTMTLRGQGLFLKGPDFSAI